MRPSRPVPWCDPADAAPDGLAGVGGDLHPSTLLRAYREGVFPWFNAGDPILWWSPDPRAVIPVGGLHVSRSLRRTLNSGRFRTTVNACFGEVMRECGRRRDGGTWVTREMVAAYQALHRLGHAHSVEAWVRDGTPEAAEEPPGPGWELAGGIYGVALGGLFSGESMFYRVSDGSKVALAALEERLRERGFALFDVQMTTEHTARMGAVEVSRAEYLERLRAAVALTPSFA